MNQPNDRQAGPDARPQIIKRRMRNFLLQPLLQVKIGLYCILLSVGLMLSVGAILYANLSKILNLILQLTDVPEEARDVLMKHVWGMSGWLLLAAAIYLVLTILVSVFFTHRLIGPTIAFRRHIRALSEGRFSARTFLRNGDAFEEVAEELNRLSEILERKNKQ
jgi:hypothetical protein